MNNLSTSMRAAAQDGPPSGIDLDQLINTEQRRSARMRWAVPTGALLVVLAVAVGVTVLTGRSEPDRTMPIAAATSATSSPQSVSEPTMAPGLNKPGVVPCTASLPSFCAENDDEYSQRVANALNLHAPGIIANGWDSPNPGVYCRRIVDGTSVCRLRLQGPDGSALAEITLRGQPYEIPPGVVVHFTVYPQVNGDVIRVRERDGSDRLPGLKSREALLNSPGGTGVRIVVYNLDGSKVLGSYDSCPDLDKCLATNELGAPQAILSVQQLVKISMSLA